MTQFPFDLSRTEDMLAWTKDRIATGPDPKHGAQSSAALDPILGGSITPDGIGAKRAFELFTDTIVPSTRPFGHPSSLSFVASAPTRASLSFDAALGAAGIFAGNWDGGAGAIHAENQVLRWLADLAGWGPNAGGVFVAGGTLGNLSALHAARKRRADKIDRPARWAILCSEEAHSSIKATAEIMDVDLIKVPTDQNGKMTAKAAKAAMTESVFVIVANAGATNCGAVDDLSGLAELSRELGLWLHVDGAYGLAAISDPLTRSVFDGIAGADSLIVDPHKWLFAPYDSCALIFADARDGSNAHGQRAAYLDAVEGGEFNPSDYAIHLTRRARGLPLWFSLATHGVDAYGAAIQQTMTTAREIATGISQMPGLELVLGPQLTVILFTATGMSDVKMEEWAEANRRSGAILCLPTTWQGRKVFRLCIVNPDTKARDILGVLETLT